MLDSIRAALAEIVQTYVDTRTHYCQLAATALGDGLCFLAGTVLDQTTQEEVLAALRLRFPDLAFDTAAVRVLRGPANPTLAVITNLTGLYAGPSFLAEQVSQLLNGARLELLQEDGRWCFVRQGDGYLGWAYRPYLAEPSGCTATHLVGEPIGLLRSAPAADAPLVGRVLAGTVLAADVHTGDWSHVTLEGGLAGWLPSAELRPLTALPADEASRREQMMADAARFVGVPYLWGGCSALGIDCSGFAQLLHRLVGVTLPRDADMQFEGGMAACEPFRPGDLLFFSEGDRRKITHVGVSLGGWRIIHSSRSRNGVYTDDVQAVDHLRESFVAARNLLWTT
ncbi:MAG: C40 family peptidase [Anaerolineae bacterium]